MVHTTNPLHPDDVLVSLLALGDESRAGIRAHTREIHEVVRGLKTAFPDVFEGFVFSTSTSFPYSEQLAGALQHLQWTRVIGMENPDFHVYVVKPAVQSVFEDVVKSRLSDSDVGSLRAAAQRFWDALGEP